MNAHHVIAVDMGAVNGVAARQLRDRTIGLPSPQRRIDRIEIVLTHEESRQLVNGRKIRSFVKHAFFDGSITQINDCDGVFAPLRHLFDSRSVGMAATGMRMAARPLHIEFDRVG